MFNFIVETYFINIQGYLLRIRSSLLIVSTNGHRHCGSEDISLICQVRSQNHSIKGSYDSL